MAYEYDRRFVNMMRRELGCDQLDIVWRPNVPRYDPLHRVDKESQLFEERKTGCWAVIHRVRECQYVQTKYGRLIFSVVVEKDVMHLDGNHDLPFTPGRWVIEAMATSDRMRHPRRLRDVDDWREKKEIEKQKRRDRAAFEMTHNEDFYKAFKKWAEDAGTAIPTDAELLEIERDAMKSAQLQASIDLYDRKNARMHDAKRVF